MKNPSVQPPDENLSLSERRRTAARKLERKRKVKFLSVSQKFLYLIIKAALELRAGARAEAKSSRFKIIGTFLLLVTDFSSSEAF